MRVLAIDTALDACQAAVAEDGRVLAWRSEPMQRGHQERLAPLVQTAMAEAAVSFAWLDRVAVTVGPGSFTGLRVGLAFAKGVALALRIPCLGFGTLEALAVSVGDDRVAAVIEARPEGCYLQCFVRGSADQPPRRLSLDRAEAAVRGAGPLRIVGPGATLLGGRTEVAWPDIAALALRAAAAGPADYPPKPLYLRAPGAQTIAERAAALG